MVPSKVETLKGARGCLSIGSNVVVHGVTISAIGLVCFSKILRFSPCHHLGRLLYLHPILLIKSDHLGKVFLFCLAKRRLSPGLWIM